MDNAFFSTHLKNRREKTEAKANSKKIDLILNEPATLIR